MMGKKMRLDSFKVSIVGNRNPEDKTHRKAVKRSMMISASTRMLQCSAFLKTLIKQYKKAACRQTG